ncbi:MAG: hypothetical protein ABIA04_05910 [Pseudomonadota bacterium]
MTKVIIKINLFILIISYFALAMHATVEIKGSKRIIRPIDYDLSFTLNSKRYYFEIESDIDIFYEKLHPLSGVPGYNVAWRDYFNTHVGDDMDLNEADYFEDIVDQIIEQTGGNIKLNFLVAQKIVSELVEKEYRKLNNKAHFYLPWELLFIGIKTEEEGAILLGALFSFLCFEIYFVYIDSDWHLAVVPESKCSNNTYALDDIIGKEDLYIFSGKDLLKADLENSPLIDIREVCMGKKKSGPSKIPFQCNSISHSNNFGSIQTYYSSEPDELIIFGIKDGTYRPTGYYIR